MRISLLLFVLLPTLVFGQVEGSRAVGSGKLQYYLNLYNSSDGSAGSVEDVVSFVEKLDHKRSSFRNDRDFLTYMFNKTHQRFLRHYVQYASFGEMTSKRSFNCLTGTALFALLLDHFNIDHQVLETNYHIFLLAQTEQGEVLIETTDPANGFVTNPKEIESRVAQYKQNEIQMTASSSKTYYRYQVELYHQVNLDKMLGLLHFNLSIVAYNERHLSLSIDQLGKAMLFYPSARTDEFSKVILLTVLESKMESSVREKCLEKINLLRKSHQVVTASTN